MSTGLVRYPPPALWARAFGWLGAGFAATAFLPDVIIGFVRRQPQGSIVFAWAFFLGSLFIFIAMFLLHAQITQKVMGAIIASSTFAVLIQHWIFPRQKGMSDEEHQAKLVQDHGRLSEKRSKKSVERRNPQIDPRTPRRRRDKLRQGQAQVQDFLFLELGTDNWSLRWKWVLLIVTQLLMMCLWAMTAWSVRNDPAQPDAYKTEFHADASTIAGFALASGTILVLMVARIRELSIAWRHHRAAEEQAVHDGVSDLSLPGIHPRNHPLEMYKPVLNPSSILWWFFWGDNFCQLLSILLQLGDDAMTEKRVYLLYEAPFLIAAATPILIDTIIIVFGFYALHFYHAHTEAGRTEGSAKRNFDSQVREMRYGQTAQLHARRTQSDPRSDSEGDENALLPRTRPRSERPTSQHGSVEAARGLSGPSHAGPDTSNGSSKFTISRKPVPPGATFVFNHAQPHSVHGSLSSAHSRKSLDTSRPYSQALDSEQRRLWQAAYNNDLAN